MGALQLYRAKLVDSEISTLCRAELVQALIDGDLGDLDDVDNLAHGSTEVVHPCREDQGRATDACRTPTGGHPVSIHALDNPDGLAGHLHHGGPEFKLLREPVDQAFGVNGVHEEDIAP